MAKTRMVKVNLVFQGRQEPGPCECPCCHNMGKVLPHKGGDKWATFQCPQCGWYMVPTMNADPRTEFSVQVWREIQVQPRKKTGGN